MEVIGFPEEHVNKVATNVLEKLKKEENIEVIKEDLPKAEKVKESIFAAMIEVELKINNYAKLMHFCYDYLPSTIEIVDMEKIAMPAREFTNGLNDLIAKLHQYNLTLNNLMNHIEKIQPKTKEKKEEN